MEKTGSLKTRVLALLMMMVLSISLVPLPAFATAGGGDSSGDVGIQVDMSELAIQDGESDAGGAIDISTYFLICDVEWGYTGSPLTKIGTSVTLSPTNNKKDTGAIKNPECYTISYKDSAGRSVTPAPTEVGTYTLTATANESVADTGDNNSGKKYKGAVSVDIEVVPFFNVYRQVDDGKPVLVKKYDALADFEKLKEDNPSPVSGLYYGKAWQVSTAVEYVTLDRILDEAGMMNLWTDDASVNYGGDPKQNKEQQSFTKAQIDKLMFYPNAINSESNVDGAVPAPFVFALSEYSATTKDGVNAKSVQDSIVAGADGYKPNANNAPRAVLGVDPDQYKAKDGLTTKGMRLWSNVPSIVIKVHSVDITGADVTLGTSSATYTGSAIAPAVSKVVLPDKTELTADDYDVSYSTNTNVGTATVTVTGKGAYNGTASTTFAINPASIAAAKVTADDQTYTGKALTPAPKVVLGDKTLVADTDYTVSYASNIEAGNATITVTGKGNYTGMVTGTFAIKAASTDTTKAVETTDTTTTTTTTTTDTASDKGLAKGEEVTTGTGAKAATVEATSDSTVAYVAPKSASAKKVTVPDTVKVNGKTYKVTSVSASAFKNSKATSITVGKNVTTIGKGAFQNAKKLTKLTLGKNVKSIGKNALKGAKKLTKLTLKSAKLSKTAMKNLVKGSKLKTIKLSGVSGKVKKDYKKWAKAYGVTVK